ncbi:hypothetical protein ABZ570_08890 [Micromonospora sp. NPDC007271]|uniref:hypothetical protein n=1 Tax=Micromonospora sp. NPDC007271 TaxID=3154587 RepID=UPI0033ECC305
MAALALTGGCSRSERTTERPLPQPPAVTSLPDEAVELPWASAMVARDGTHITVYGGSGDTPCKELRQPQATVTAQDETQVVVTVKARIVDATDCGATGFALPLVASLRKPLGDRVLRDAATTQAPPTYFERDLPDLSSDKRWSRHPSHWMSTDPSWHQGYNGPHGSMLLLSAQPTADVSLPDPVTTVPIGSRRGTVTGDAGRSWTVWWKVGAVTYSLRVTPPEGGRFTLTQFKQELAGLSWR